MKTWKLTVNEDELKALIRWHSDMHGSYQNEPNVERSQRIHDLTKRLNRDSGEVELSNDPRPEQQNENQQATNTNQTGAW